MLTTRGTVSEPEAAAIYALQYVFRVPFPPFLESGSGIVTESLPESHEYADHMEIAAWILTT